MATLTVRRIAAPCEAPRCTRAATQEVNLSVFVSYMAKQVCNRHVAWAEQALKRHLPTDR